MPGRTTSGVYVCFPVTMSRPLTLWTGVPRDVHRSGGAACIADAPGERPSLRSARRRSPCGHLPRARGRRPPASRGAIDLPLRGRLIDQHFARRRRSRRNLRRHRRRRARSERALIERREIGVGHHERDRRESGTRSSSATTWESDVRMFWPISTLPVYAVTRAARVDVHPCVDVGGPFASALSASRFLLRMRRQRGDDEQTAAHGRCDFQKIAPIHFQRVEAVSPRARRARSVPARSRRRVRDRSSLATCRPLRLHAIGREFDGRHDARIGAATTDVAIEKLRDVVVRRLRMFAQEADRRHHHAGRAVAALKRLGVEKRLLHRMQAIAVRRWLRWS